MNLCVAAVSISFAGFDLWWLGLAAIFLLFGMYVAVCRQVLSVFSRKLLFESAPAERHKEIEEYLDHEDEYTSSLRTLDHLLRLALVLSLASGRFVALAGEGFVPTLGNTALACLRLAAELSAVIFVFLEILPGILARVRPEATLLRLARGIDRIHRVLAPLRSMLEGLIRFGARALGGEADRTSADILEEEILQAAEEGGREGLLQSRQIDMIESIITFGGVEVSEVMTPRTEMVCLDVEEPFRLNLERAIQCGHSRIPVYRESKDKIVGILHVKDLLRYWERKDSIVLQDVLRKPHFVPLSKKIGELLHEFKTQRFHMAIVLDEFGGTSGLITIEDVIEEIVGEITDEFETVESLPINRLEPNLADVDASLRIDELNDQLGISIPEGETYDTVGGFLFAHMGKMPRVGEAFEIDSVRFEVTAADERRIRRIRISLPEGEKKVEEETKQEEEKSERKVG